MKLKLTIVLSILFITVQAKEISAEKSNLTNGLFIAAPESQHIDLFIDFINKDLKKHAINKLVLSIDYNYQFKSYPKLSNDNALSEKELKLIATTCRENNIELIPHFNLLGHQSWAENVSNLLREYPQFDETPHIKMPEKYTWPNSDNLLCKSYCTNHPEVHRIVFSLIKELIETCKSSSFHVGLDLVLYIGDEHCKRCKEHKQEDLYADEINRIYSFLSDNECQMWMWGDRLLNRSSFGLNEFEGAGSSIYKAIDKLPKEIVICDWHYKNADPSSVYFASNGFDVYTCQWDNPEIAVQQKLMLDILSKHSSKTLAPHFKGMIHTVWSPAHVFINNLRNNSSEDKCVQSFLAIF
ncbi:family 20 glycosylhydrolase [Carboxylicivirga sp. N1Y90]|uniref:family 20 glycosylhydrolase n=1 Tax=Carboxylicivirga fragile TaxID=3417571 RepID=UPI003D33B9C6|nr:family 20 glycosylhydrolase [Marinilabiliaceae bacterium N1Y90]